MMNGLPTPPTTWQEARTAEGKVYYYNVHTKATQWTKPIELMTPVEVTRPIRAIKRYTNERSVHCHSNHGKNIPRRKGGSTGQIQKPKLAPGKCQRLTKMRLLRHSRHRDQHRSESDRRPSSTTFADLSRAPTFVAGGTSSLSSFPPPRDRDEYNTPERREPERRSDYAGVNGVSIATSGAEQAPDYSTF